MATNKQIPKLNLLISMQPFLHFVFTIYMPVCQFVCLGHLFQSIRFVFFFFFLVPMNQELNIKTLIKEWLIIDDLSNENLIDSTIHIQLMKVFFSMNHVSTKNLYNYFVFSNIRMLNRANNNWFVSKKNFFSL